MEDLLKTIQEAKKICAQKKIDLKNYNNVDSLEGAIGLFYVYFDGFLPRVENYVMSTHREEEINVFSKLINDFNWSDIGVSDIETFLENYPDPRSDAKNRLWQPMLNRNVQAGPNKIEAPKGWKNNSYDPVCKRSEHGFWSFADVKGTLSTLYKRYKEETNK